MALFFGPSSASQPTPTKREAAPELTIDQTNGKSKITAVAAAIKLCLGFFKNFL